MGEKGGRRKWGQRQRGVSDVYPDDDDIYPKGTKVYKDFDEIDYEGVVTGYNPYYGWYQIRYDDSNKEDMNHRELEKFHRRWKENYRARERAARVSPVLERRAMSIPTPKGRAYAAGGGIWDQVLGKNAQYRDLTNHPDPAIRARWLRAGENEFRRLF